MSAAVEDTTMFSPEVAKNGTAAMEATSPATGSPVIPQRLASVVMESSPVVGSRRTRSPQSALPQRHFTDSDLDLSPEDMKKRKKALSRWPSTSRWSSFTLKGGLTFQLGEGAEDPVREPSAESTDSSFGRDSVSNGSESNEVILKRHVSLERGRSSFRLRRTNSLADTKTLFMCPDMRTSSFVEGPEALQPFREPSEFCFHDHFVWDEKLGTGSFADVFAVRHKKRPDEKYAIKVYKGEFKSRNERAERLKEAEIANQLAPHPNVISYYRVWQDSQLMYVQMELCEQGSLRDQMIVQPLCKPAADSLTWSIVRQLASGLTHVHAHGMLHCDIKPDNVLITMSCGQLIYKLGDLGQATFIAQWDEHEGDARYLSRDLLDSKPSPAADIFSFGIMMLEVKTGIELPGHGDAWEQLRNESPRQYLTAAHTSDSKLADLITSMMAAEPSSRPEAVVVGAACPLHTDTVPMASPRLMTPRSAQFLARRDEDLLSALENWGLLSEAIAVTV